MNLLYLLAWALSALGQYTEEKIQLAISNVTSMAQAAVNSSAVPGVSIAIVYNGSVVYSGGFGVRDTSTNESYTADTVQQMASVSKPLSATIVAAMITASNGSLAWDNYTNSPGAVAPYSDPWISQELRLYDGFSHRSGLYGLSGDDLEELGLDRNTILSRLQYMAPIYPFRAGYTYSNYGITAAAISTSDKMNMTWDDAAQEYLYGPLGMTSSSSSFAEFLTRTNRASLHVPASQIPGYSNSTNATQWEPTGLRNPDAQSPAGGVSSSANDMAKWLQLQLGLGVIPNTTNRLIDEAPLNETHTPFTVRGKSAFGITSFYGLGFGVDYRQMGARSSPMPVPLRSRDWVAFWDGIYGGLEAAESGGAPTFGAAPQNPSPMLAAEAYTGMYYNDYVGLMQVAAGSNGTTSSSNGTSNTTTSGSGGGGDLTISFPVTSNMTFPLTHWDRDTFSLNTVPQLNTAIEPVIFAIGADGNATTVMVDRLNGNGGGILNRVMDNSS
ncbi:uncharacterized protein AB675_3169 [Cyphellophora attinorum]|uniref:Beta-lactamase-related domain-containing protein n=1 Tax=Cyphellophora attinorum TaxID=1664694 RepID=A0A0N1H1B9_9EURO|nr:uncharacterized protein AB675_3169 [Phialophora attinorum]KPI37855.1 hypothetical protein AB675_3169 [Phialophora attinorum]